MSIATGDKIPKYKDIRMFFSSFIADVLAPIVGQVTGNTEDIGELEGRVSTVEGEIESITSPFSTDAQGYITYNYQEVSNGE